MNMMKIIWLFAVLLVFVSGDEENTARVLVEKNVLNHYVVEKKDLTLEYILYNIGTTSALDVELKDENFPAEFFSLESGVLSTRWSAIAPGANVTHVIVLKPLSAGFFNFTSALVSYRAQEEAKQVTFGYSTAPGELPIFAFTEFTKNFSSHTTDWLSFALLTTPSLLIPFLLWLKSKSKYENMPGKNKGH